MSTSRPGVPAAHFESFANGRGWNASFSDPIEQRAVFALHEIIPLLERSAAAAKQGKWVALALSYEAAPAFDSALEVKTSSDFPLAWMGVFDDCRSAASASVPDLPFQVSAWDAKIDKREYRRAIQSIRDYIESGDTYQINFTFPLRGYLTGDLFSCFRAIGSDQGAAYSAYLDIGSHMILSFSPELFVERRGNTLTTRPMKGTLARGRWLEEDDQRALQLMDSAKDRAENVMIVDLMRSDLGKIAETGSVSVPELFAVERITRVHQMTSTVTAVQRPGTGVVEILRALFPSGSVTGAPKARSMAIITELESEPRGIYTGAIGMLNPNGDAVFSVPIRTVVVDSRSGEAALGVGGAITWDSTTEGEYEESRLKAKFLTDPWPEFDLLETLALRDGEYALLDRHIARARDSARYFGFHWNESDILRALDDVRTANLLGQWRVRLLIGRNRSARAEAHSMGEARTTPLVVKFASDAVDDRDPLIFHKISYRSRYERELERCQPCDDVIFWNSRGEVTESTIANVVVSLDGKHWTPPRTAGLLAGTFRAELISKGELFERTITKQELAAAESFALINSVRGWMPAKLATESALLESASR